MTRCGQCRELFRIPEPTPESTDRPQPEVPRRETPRTPVVCSVCDTRIYVPLQHVGKKAKCPDCDTLNLVLPPEAERQRRTPAAFDGDQYQVWEGEDQPWAADLIARQVKLIPVTCRHCGTLMHARTRQVGKSLTCPDCATKTVVTEPKAEKPKQSVLSADDYKLKRERPSPGKQDGMSQVANSYMADAEAELRREAEFGKKRKTRRATGEEINLPRFPLLTGLFSFFGSGGLWPRVFGIALSLGLLGILFADGLEAMMAFSRGAALLVNASSLAGVMEMVVAVCLGILATAALAASGITTVAESSEGNDKIYQWPHPNPMEWLGEFAYLAIATMTAALPGWIICQVLPLIPDAPVLGPLEKVIAVAVSLVLLLPITLLSQLDYSSAFGLVSPRLLAGFFSAPWSGLVFLAQSSLIAAGLIGLGMLVARHGPLFILIVMPPAVLLVMVYFRQLGRLAWVIAERTTVFEDET